MTSDIPSPVSPSTTSIYLHRLRCAGITVLPCGEPILLLQSYSSSHSLGMEFPAHVLRSSRQSLLTNAGNGEARIENLTHFLRESGTDVSSFFECLP